jgi:hypothetical protein
VKGDAARLSTLTAGWVWRIWEAAAGSMGRVRVMIVCFLFFFFLFGALAFEATGDRQGQGRQWVD